MSLTFEQDLPGVLVVRLVVDRAAARLVELELTGDEFVRLLAGQTMSVPSAAGEAALPDGEPAVDLDVGSHADEPDVEPVDELAVPEDVDEVEHGGTGAG